MQFYDPAAFDAEATTLASKISLAAMKSLGDRGGKMHMPKSLSANPAYFSNYTLSLLQRFTVIHDQAAGTASFTATIDQLVRAWMKITAERDFCNHFTKLSCLFFGEPELGRYPFIQTRIHGNWRPQDRDRFLETGSKPMTRRCTHTR